MNLIDAPRMESTLEPGTRFDWNWANSVCVHSIAVTPLDLTSSQLHNRFTNRFTTEPLLNP